MSDRLTWLDFFHGGVPPYQVFRLSFDELGELVASSEQSGPNRIAEVCFIGLAAYFEAFCKDQFAAIINIYPETLAAFSEKRPDATIPLRILHRFTGRLNYRLGSLVTEQYDFGSAKAVNGLFGDLLRVTPFSKAEAAEYGRFLNDRNLLVHHGGIYTQQYEQQRFKKQRIPHRRLYYDSLVITKENFQTWASWMNGMARKITITSHKGLLDFARAQHVRVSQERKKAADSLLWLD